MRILHQKLHLQHHRHTGKMLHHRHTSYRSLALVFIVAAAVMGGLAVMQRVTAESLSISVTVHVPRPQTPAVIALPADGVTIPDGDTMIAGSCPIVSPQAVVLVSVDGATAGSAVCDGNNNFSLSADLTPGAHTILADAYSIDGDKGPSSQPLHITCRTVVHNGTTGRQPFTFSSDNTFTTIASNKNIEWSGTIAGNKSPYKLSVDWGDGTYGSYTVQTGAVHASHRYANLASYNITVAATDSAGNYQHQQFAATASTADNPNPLSTALYTDQTSSRTATVMGLYGIFVTIVCVAAIVRLHAVPFAYTNITLKHHGAH